MNNTNLQQYFIVLFLFWAIKVPIFKTLMLNKYIFLIKTLN